MESDTLITVGTFEYLLKLSLFVMAFLLILKAAYEYHKYRKNSFLKIGLDKKIKKKDFFDKFFTVSRRDFISKLNPIEQDELLYKLQIPKAILFSKYRDRLALQKDGLTSASCVEMLSMLEKLYKSDEFPKIESITIRSIENFAYFKVKKEYEDFEPRYDIVFVVDGSIRTGEIYNLVALGAEHIQALTRSLYNKKYDICVHKLIRAKNDQEFDEIIPVHRFTKKEIKSLLLEFIIHNPQFIKL